VRARLSPGAQRRVASSISIPRAAFAAALSCSMSSWSIVTTSLRWARMRSSMRIGVRDAPEKRVPASRIQREATA